jgi:hypothetical protein
LTSAAIATGLKVYGKPATYSGKPAIISGKPATYSGNLEKVAGFPPESVAGLLRNGWPICSGISGRFAPEYAGIKVRHKARPVGGIPSY